MHIRLGHKWIQVSESAASRRSSRKLDGMDDDCIDRLLYKSLRAMLFHFSAALDVSEFQIEFINATSISTKASLKLLYFAVTGQTVEQDGACSILNRIWQLSLEFFKKKCLSVCREMDSKNRQRRSSFVRNKNRSLKL